MAHPLLRNPNVRNFLCQIGGLALLLVLSMGVSPLVNGSRIVSSADTDLINQFAAWRAFAAEQVSHGHLPLWNPFVYGGAPFLGGFQSALFYPPNIIFLILPLGLAINWIIYFHLWLAGAGMILWATRRGLHPYATFVCGVMLMLGGRMITHVYAGHMAQIMTMAWAPFLFLAIDEWFVRPDFRWILGGAVFAALQFLGGHIQYAYYVALAAGLYVLLRLVYQKDFRPAWGLLAIYPLGFLLTAVQFLPGFAAKAESVRSSGVGYNFAAMFSFPPENLITLIAPYFFGDMIHVPYWGRCYLWEMSIFFGSAGILLAVYGALQKNLKRGWTDAWMVLLLFIVALGDHTPLFQLLYSYMPGFDSFRCIAKFNFPASLFLIQCAGLGLHRVITGEAPRRLLAMIAAGIGVLCILCAVCLNQSWIAAAMAGIRQTRESYLPPNAFANLPLQNLALEGARWSLWASAFAFLISGALLLFSSRRAAQWGLVAVLSLEIALVAHWTAVKSSLSQVAIPDLVKFVADHPGDYRVLNLLQGNNGYFLGKPDAWGNDPGVLKRYAEFIAFTQGENPDEASQYVNFHQLDPLLSLIRLRYVFAPQSEGRLQIAELPHPMDRFYLISNFQVLSARDDIFAAMRAGHFDPRTSVILESAPSPLPDPAPPQGNIQVQKYTADQTILQVKTAKPAILLMTDNYSRDWKVRALPGSAQSTYELLPADYTVRAIPLSAGEHHLEIDYAPSSLVYGAWLSLLSLLSWAAAFIYCSRRRFPATW